MKTSCPVSTTASTLSFDTAIPESHIELMEALGKKGVQLESVLVRAPMVFLTVRVLNVAFEKHVAIRYTSDDWKTYADVEAHYFPGSADGRSDRFYVSTFVVFARMPCVVYKSVFRGVLFHSFGICISAVTHVLPSHPTASLVLCAHHAAGLAADAQLQRQHQRAVCHPLPDPGPRVLGQQRRRQLPHVRQPEHPLSHAAVQQQNGHVPVWFVLGLPHWPHGLDSLCADCYDALLPLCFVYYVVP